jgi:hypothetical protein
MGWPVMSVSYSVSSADELHQTEHVAAPAIGQIRGDTAGPDVVVVHPQAGDLLEEPQDLFALAPAVEHHRHGPDVHAVGRQEQQVRRDPVELGHEHADPDRPLGHLDLEELLDGEGERQLGEQRRGVVHAGDVGAALHVGQLLTRPLHAGVQVADDGLGAQDGLAPELHHEAQHPVRGRVLRPHVDEHGLVFGRRVSSSCAPRSRTCAAHAFRSGPRLTEVMCGWWLLAAFRRGDGAVARRRPTATAGIDTCQVIMGQARGRGLNGWGRP